MLHFGTPFLEQPERWWHMEDKWNACGFLVGKREGKRPRGRCRPRLEDTIKMELTEIGWEDVDCINLVQGRENLLAVLNVWNFLTSWTVSCWETGHHGVGQSVSRSAVRSVVRLSQSQWIEWNYVKFEVVTAVNFNLQFSGLWFSIVLYTSTNILDDCTATFYCSKVEANSIESLIQI